MVRAAVHDMALAPACEDELHELPPCHVQPQLREQLAASGGDAEPPNVMVLDESHVGLAVLNNLHARPPKPFHVHDLSGVSCGS